MRRLLATSALLAGCLVEGGKDLPLVVGEGAVTVDPATQAIRVDEAKVPVLANCPAGQSVIRGASGWECREEATARQLSDARSEAAAAGAALQAALSTQIAGKAPLSHTHAVGQVVGFDAAVAQALQGAQVPGDLRVAGSLRLGDAGTAWDAATEQLLVAGDARMGGLVIGGRPFARRITVCSYSNPSHTNILDNHNRRPWQVGECDNELPSGQCTGFFTRAVASGADQDWEVVAPGEQYYGGQPAGPTGGVGYWTSGHGLWVRAVYFCF